MGGKLHGAKARYRQKQDRMAVELREKERIIEAAQLSIILSPQDVFLVVFKILRKLVVADFRETSSHS